MIDYTYRELFHNSSVDKQWIITDGDEITLTNDDIYSEEITLEESVCDEDHLVFGTCNGSILSFTTSSLTKMQGKRITVSIILDGNDEEPFIVGTYTVMSDELTADRQKREIKAYDDLHILNNTNVADWYNGLSFPLTLKQFRDSFFNLFNITQETTTLVNDNMTVEKTVNAEVLSSGTVIQSICEINGRCGHINREGVFVYLPMYKGSIALYPSLTLYPGNRLFPSIDKPGAMGTDVTASEYSQVEYEDYTVKPIDKLQIRQEENDIGAIAGTGTNAYIVEDNFLVYGKNAADLGTIANNLFTEIQDTVYTPLKVTCIGDPCVEVGDIVQVQTSDGRFIDTFVMSRTLKGLQALTDEIESRGEEYQKEEVNSLNTEVIQLKGKTTTIEKNVEGVRVEVEDLAEDTSASLTILDNKIATKVATSDFNSTVTQLSNQISTKVTHGNISSEISQEAGQISISANRIAITSDKFTLNTDGTVNCSAMNITGGSLNMIKDNYQLKLDTDGLIVADKNDYGNNRCQIQPLKLLIGKVNSTKYLSYDAGLTSPTLNLRGSGLTITDGSVIIGSSNHSQSTTIYHKSITLNGGTGTTYSTTIKGMLTCSSLATFDDGVLVYSGNLTIRSGNLTVTSGNTNLKNLSVSGTKNRVVKTKNYNTRALNAYETAECYFGDIGEGQLDDDGICTIQLDPIFLETVNTKIPYQVFLQAYGDGKCWVESRCIDNFTVNGTPGLKFAYEIKAKQLGFEDMRLEEIELPKTEEVNEDANKLSTNDLGK